MILFSGTLTVNGSGTIFPGNVRDYRNETRHLVISQGIRSIEEETFRGWQELESVTLPDTLKEIGDYAFSILNLRKVTYNGSYMQWDRISIAEGNEELVPKVKFKYGLSLQSIRVKKPPVKTEYHEGETFDPTGMVVTADYTDFGTKISREVDNYVIEDTEPLVYNQGYVPVRYTAGPQVERTYVGIHVTG